MDEEPPRGNATANPIIIIIIIIIKQTTRLAACVAPLCLYLDLKPKDYAVNV